MSKNIVSSLALLRELQHDLYEIARYAELGSHNSFDSIQKKSEQSLKLIDSVLLSAMVESGQTKLDLRPVGAGSIMHDTAYELRQLNGKPITVSAKSNNLINTSREILGGLLFSLGTFMSASTDKPLLISSFDEGDYVAVGVFAKRFDITQSEYNKALEFMERAIMPMAQHTNRSGVMLLLASKLAQNLETEVIVKKKFGHRGFVIKLPKNQQLSLVSAG